MNHSQEKPKRGEVASVREKLGPVAGTSPRDSRLFELFKAAIEIGLEYVRLAEQGKTQIGKYENWPELQWHDNGLPWLTSGSEGPRKYSDAVQGLYPFLYGLGSGEPVLDFRKEPKVLALLDYVKTEPRLKEYFLVENSPEMSESRILSIVGDVLDRHIHVSKKVELNPDKLLSVYLPIESCLFNETLSAVVVAPILFVKFEVRRLDFTESISIKELSSDLQLARAYRGPFHDADNSLVEDAATHALFIAHHSVENRNWIALGQVTGQPESYPREVIDMFFGAFRIATGYPTGYAQLLMLPLGWASGYEADLIPLERVSVRQYPPFFEHGYWREQIPTATETEVFKVKEVFSQLVAVLKGKHGRKVRLAIHRLNLSSMRTTDEDGVIDAIIALEALLSDGSQEMTHKVAMRLAALYKVVDPSRSHRAFKELKRIYKFRSKIVHGESNLEEDRVLDRDGEKISSLEAAVEHLRTAFSVLVKNPALLDPGNVDSFLLTGEMKSG